MEWIQIIGQHYTQQCTLQRESCFLTVTGLGTAATTMPMVGWGDGGMGLPQGTLSALFVWPSPGKGECSFCSCCLLWIFLWSCCFASTVGEDRVVTWGWKEWASAVGMKAETVCGVVMSEERKQGDLDIYRATVICKSNNLYHDVMNKLELHVQNVWSQHYRRRHNNLVRAVRGNSHQMPLSASFFHTGASCQSRLSHLLQCRS